MSVDTQVLRAPAAGVTAAMPGKVTMLKRVQPYHDVGTHRHGGVYHDRSDCPAGQRLHSDHLVAGTWNLPRCGQCRVLDEMAPVRG
jgi:hypothetical protein